MSVDVLTFGCRLNAVESEAIRERAGEAGLSGVIVVNTCAVTAEAVRQARQAIRKARRENPSARILVTGCAAQTEPETFAAMEEVDLVIGNGEKTARATWEDARAALASPGFSLDGFEKVRVNDVMSIAETAGHLADGFAAIDGLSGRARAFVQVQNGCDHRCTFCIIPYGRGPSRSVPAGAVIDQIRRLVANGYNEVVLTGVDLTSWGGNLPGTPRLGRLVRQILRHVPDLKRLRLSSIDSIEVDAELMRALAEEDRLMPHLHLSLQAGDDMILKRMKRRHLRDDAIRFCSEARRLRPDVVFGADLIAGFPTESEAMFENTLRLVEECDLTFLHVFPFSPRRGTPAARMPQLDRRIVKERAARLREMGAARLAAHLAAQVGRQRSVLVERAARDGLIGRTEQFAEVALAPDIGTGPGSVVAARITGHDGARLLATAA